jgi:hypothetical protein
MKLRPNFPSPSSPVESRLLAEYGSMFITKAAPPPKILFRNEAEVLAFQESLDTGQARVGTYQIELQYSAMLALETAVALAAANGISITARSADSGRRSFQDTLNLWLRNVGRGLDHWIELGRITAQGAQSIRELDFIQQVGVILDMEESQGIYFSTYFDRSILSSVAAPGASQHLSLLAFDVAEYQDEKAEAVLSSHGWYRTVVSDLPHFTYLGHSEDALPRLGLRLAVRKQNSRMYRFWIPDLI